MAKISKQTVRQRQQATAARKAKAKQQPASFVSSVGAKLQQGFDALAQYRAATYSRKDAEKANRKSPMSLDRREFETLGITLHQGARKLARAARDPESHGFAVGALALAIFLMLTALADAEKQHRKATKRQRHLARKAKAKQA